MAAITANTSYDFFLRLFYKMESDSEPAQPKIVKISDTSELPEKPKKDRKPRSEAQKAASKRMMEALAMKRKQAAEAEEADMIAATEYDKQEKLKLHYEIAKMKKSKKLPPIPQYVTTAQIELMERRIMAALPKEVYREVPLKVVEKTVPVPVDVIHTVHKETIREKPTVVEKKVSGNELLDKIFFNK